MGVLDMLLGPIYNDAAKMKKTPAAPAAPAPPSKPKKQAVQKESIPTVATVQRPVQQDVPAPEFGENTKPLTPEELKAAAEYLGLLSKNTGTKPVFNIDDLMPKKDDIDAALQDLPIDIRPVASFMDTMYGTKSYANTPNLRADAIMELKAKRDLDQGSVAMQQVRAQAKLAEYKADLQNYTDLSGAQNPLEMAKTYEALSKSLRGNQGDFMAKLRMLLDVKKHNDDNREQNGKENRLIDKELRQSLNEEQDKFAKSPIVINHQKIMTSVRQARDLLYTDRSGTADYATVINFVRGLDPASTVMFNEAAGVYKAGGLIAQIMNTPEAMWSGSRLSPEQKTAIVNIMNRFEERSRQAYEKARRGAMEGAASIGVDPKKAVTPVDETLSLPDQIFYFKRADGKGKPYAIKGPQVEEFKADMARQGIKVLGAGSK